MHAQLIEEQLKVYETELTHELGEILYYWIKYTPDQINGGFIGQIDDNEQIVPTAAKGSVLNARILWSFSATYNLDKNPVYLQYADRAYRYIVDYFLDKEHGGIFWTVDYEGNPLDTKKQVYGIAFTIYALSEYYMASGDEQVKELAVSLYKLIVHRSYDSEATGYLEAFTRDWQPINDLRLSAKDANEKKTMNTHLHVLEAYTNLYRIWRDEGLKAQITTLLHNFLEHFIDPKTYHLLLFFDEGWNSRSDTISYGHDIEATWLLQEAAEVINDELLLEKIKAINISISDVTLKGIDADGGLWYEYDTANNHLIKEKHWWPQAEAMVGFFNSWQFSGDPKYLDQSLQSWKFVKDKILDNINGEWIWGIDEKDIPMNGEDKVGIWKCPYHNSRACIEIIKRISADKNINHEK